MVDYLIEHAFEGKNVDAMTGSQVKGIIENSVLPQLRNFADAANRNNQNLNNAAKQFLKLVGADK